MDINQLPQSTLLGYVIGHAALKALLGESLFRGQFTHMQPIHGAGRSGRILSSGEIEGSVPFPHPMDADEMATELLKLEPVARYDPPQNPTAQKGWEVRFARLDAYSAVVWTTWVK